MRAKLAKLSCLLWGHHVDNHVFKQAMGHDRRCRCGADYLAEDRSITRVRHTLSCFLGQHDYEKLADRDGSHEYVCTQCGHSLLKPEGGSEDPPLRERVIRHPATCVVSGHLIQFLTKRGGFAEYVCKNCGHPFCFAVVLGT